MLMRVMIYIISRLGHECRNYKAYHQRKSKKALHNNDQLKTNLYIMMIQYIIFDVNRIHNSEIMNTHSSTRILYCQAFT